MPVQPKTKFIQVTLQMVLTDPVVNPPDPAFQLLYEPMYSNKILSWPTFGLGDIPSFGQWPIGPP
jgi:hypothetical protein